MPNAKELRYRLPGQDIVLKFFDPEDFSADDFTEHLVRHAAWKVYSKSKTVNMDVPVSIREVLYRKQGI